MLYQFQMPFQASGASFVKATGFVPAPLAVADAATVDYWKAIKGRLAG